jgi:hypothetical protein
VVLTAIILLVKTFHNKKTIIVEKLKDVISSLPNTIQGEVTWDIIINWFKEHEELIKADKDNLGVLIRSMENDKHKIIQVIFNKKINKILDGVQYESENLDEETIENFGDKEMIICT